MKKSILVLSVLAIAGFCFAQEKACPKAKTCDKPAAVCPCVPDAKECKCTGDCKCPVKAEKKASCPAAKACDKK